MTGYALESFGMTSDGKCYRMTEPVECGIEISHSVGRGGRNVPDDVLTVQRALNRVSPGQGQAAPLLAEDGLNGPKTEKAIYQFQVKHFGAARADARVDPGHRTIEKLRSLQPQQAGSAGSGSSAYQVASFTPLKDEEKNAMLKAEASLATAMHWSVAARFILQKATAYTTGKNQFQKHYDLVDRCFMIKSLSSHSKARTAMDKIRQIYVNMAIARLSTKPFLTKKTSGCINDKGGKVFATAFVGGFHSTDAKHKPIYVCAKNVVGWDTNSLADLLVHEMAHLCGPIAGADRIGHGGRAAPAYGLAAFTLTHPEATKSASNYAWLAWLSRLPPSEWMTNKG